MILHIRWYHWWQWYNKTKCYTCFITLCNTKVSAFLMNWRYHNLILNWCVKMILPTDTWGYFYSVSSRDYFVNASSQWKMTLQCNVISHWLGAFTNEPNPSLSTYGDEMPHDSLPFDQLCVTVESHFRWSIVGLSLMDGFLLDVVIYSAVVLSNIIVFPIWVMCFLSK